MVAGDEAMSLHDGGVVVDTEAAGYVPSYDQCQYYYHHQCTTELPVGDAGSAVAHHDVDGWVLHAAAATSPSSSSVLTFDGLGEEYSAASWWMDMDMDAHGTEPHLIGHGHGPTMATSSSSCFSSGSSGDSGMVTTTSTTPRSTASASQKRPRTPPSPSQGAELHEYSKKQRANKKEPQSSAAKSRRERISERLRALQELVPSGGKVDVVTMLDKAISYVKFMQLQLRVLETDAFWPAADGAAPDISQVKDALDAIILSSSSPSQQACRSG